MPRGRRGRAAQCPVIAPVTDRGDAIGALELALPAPPDRQTLERITGASRVLASRRGLHAQPLAVHFPSEGWGRLDLSGARPQAGSGWTDDGKPYEKRGLKHRARHTVRPVPIPPVLVAVLRSHIDRFGTSGRGAAVLGCPRRPGAVAGVRRRLAGGSGARPHPGAGVSLLQLYYAKVLDGEEARMNELIDQGLAEHADDGEQGP